MTTDNIEAIGIDEIGQLFIKPEKERFVLIWRSATEVHWDDKRTCLFSPKPREWSYLDWYKHIIGVVKDECGCKLIVTSNTNWLSIPDDLQQQIIEM